MSVSAMRSVPGSRVIAWGREKCAAEYGPSTQFTLLVRAVRSRQASPTSKRPLHPAPGPGPEMT